MSKHSKQVPPARKLRLINSRPEDGIYTWYEITAVPLGEIQFRGVRHWVTDDGMEFRSAESARDYLIRRRG